jgi:hypothetical protein
MVSQELLERVVADVRRHVRRSRGYEEGPWVNPLAPADCVAAFSMARLLTGRGLFDHYIAVAPEGHVYGYFFERLGVPVLSVHVGYPPRRVEVLDELAVIRDGRVLLLEDDVVSGMTLRLVADALGQHGPRSLALYLGRRKEDQILENVPPEVSAVYLAEDHLRPAERGQDEAEFAAFFGKCLARQGDR